MAAGKCLLCFSNNKCLAHIDNLYFLYEHLLFNHCFCSRANVKHILP